jgi:hypothetical protein
VAERDILSLAVDPRACLSETLSAALIVWMEDNGLL